MVHPQVRPLLALALEGLEKAKSLYVFRLVAHCVALALAITAAYMVEKHEDALEIVAAVLAVVCELAAFGFHHRAMEMHNRGRQAMRRVMLLDALQPDEAPAVLERARSRFSAAIQQAARRLEERDRVLGHKDSGLGAYYWSAKDSGPARLRDHLFESAIFSHRLYHAAWKFSLLCLVVLLGAVAVVVVILSSGHHALLLRLLIALIAFLPASQELDHMLLYRMVAHHLSELLQRVESLYAEPLSDAQPNWRLLAELGDYSAAATFAPPIRTWVYRHLHDPLGVEFEKKMKELGQESPS